ncbi:hypothetical protein [Streptomyces sp. C10-9-1]|uniref:hypothetical protein n=1 Tax=Streptomyces sp. C10-9-1 TaxID=1859285 RepID=UPI003D714F7C
MDHPDLPAEQQIEVDEAAVAHYRAAGWRVADDPPPETTKTTKTKAAARRRRGDDS